MKWGRRPRRNPGGELFKGNRRQILKRTTVVRTEIRAE